MRFCENGRMNSPIHVVEHDPLLACGTGPPEAEVEKLGLSLANRTGSTGCGYSIVLMNSSNYSNYIRKATQQHV